MKLIGFNFTKISAEKFLDKVDDLKINTQINIAEIKEVSSSLFKIKEKIISIKFNHSLIYDPEFAKIELGGNLLLSVESKISKEILKQWEEKKMPENFRVGLFNLILRKSSIKALELEEEFNLPLHMNIPLIKRQEEEQEETK